MSSSSGVRLCPLSPGLHADEGEGWDRLEDADVLAEHDTTLIDDEEKDDEVDADDLFGSDNEEDAAAAAEAKKKLEE